MVCREGRFYTPHCKPSAFLTAPRLFKGRLWVRPASANSYSNSHLIPKSAMADIYYADMSYCTLCDRYFPGDEARAQHVQLSSNHPKCNTCDRRFANKNSLRNVRFLLICVFIALLTYRYLKHWVYSRRHHYCAVCERDFKTAAGLRVVSSLQPTSLSNKLSVCY